MNREDAQLSFAARYYFRLCEKLIGKLNVNEKYIEYNIRNISPQKRLYEIHLASCCFRLSSLLEKNRVTSKIAYGYLKDRSNKHRNIYKYLPFLIRDTVSHNEQPSNDKFKARKRELENISVKGVHTVIKDSITKFCI